MWRSCDEWVLPKWACLESREQFLHCGLRKFRHSKSSVYRWLHNSTFVGLFMTPIRQWKRLERVTVACTVHMFITHRPTVTLQLHNFDLLRTCRTSSFCTVAWQLARFQLTRRIAWSFGDSWASRLQEAQLSPKKRATRRVSWNYAKCCTNVCRILYFKNRATDEWPLRLFKDSRNGMNR